MPSPGRRAMVIAIVAIAFLFCLDASALARKRPKRRRARSATTQTLRLVLPSPTVLTTWQPQSTQTIQPVEMPAPPATEGRSVSNTKGAPAPNPPAPATAGLLIISEFRLRGNDPDGGGPLDGSKDEFIEIYNTSASDHTVAAASGPGYAVASSSTTTLNDNNPHVLFVIPNGTVIPAHGHYLAVNNSAGGYSLGSYPAGNSTATGDITFAQDILDNDGIAIFNGGNFTDLTLANRVDAVGTTSVTNTLYREGSGLGAFTPPLNINYAWVRDTCGKGGAVNLLGPCTIATPKDTDNNAVDFYLVDTNGNSTGGSQRLGAPGPENLSSPIQRNSSFSVNLIDANVSSASPPNRVRDFTSDPANNSNEGTLSIRRRFVNNTGGNVTRLRFRVIDLDTFPAAVGFADLRPRTSVNVTIAGITDSATCAATGAPATPLCTITVQGTTLEQASLPNNQPNGGGFNSSLGASTVTLGTPLSNGASINLQFLLGIQQTGSFRFYVNVEALP